MSPLEGGDEGRARQPVARGSGLAAAATSLSFKTAITTTLHCFFYL